MAEGVGVLVAGTFDEEVRGSELPVLRPIETFVPRPEWADYHSARRDSFATTFHALQVARDGSGGTPDD